MPAQTLAESRWGGSLTVNVTGAGGVNGALRCVTVDEPYGRLWLVRRYVALSRPLNAGENINVVYLVNEGVGTTSARYTGLTDALVAGQQFAGPGNMFTGPAPWLGASQLNVDVETRNSSVLSSIGMTVTCWVAPLMPVTPLAPHHPRGPYG